jgi:hypothetical protein
MLTRRRASGPELKKRLGKHSIWWSKKRRAANGREGERGSTKEKAQKAKMLTRRRASGSVLKKRNVKSRAGAVKMQQRQQQSNGDKAGHKESDHGMTYRIAGG